MNSLNENFTDTDSRRATDFRRPINYYVKFYEDGKLLSDQNYAYNFLNTGDLTLNDHPSKVEIEKNDSKSLKSLKNTHNKFIEDINELKYGLLRVLSKNGDIITQQKELSKDSANEIAELIGGTVEQYIQVGENEKIETRYEGICGAGPSFSHRNCADCIGMGGAMPTDISVRTPVYDRVEVNNR